MLQLSKAARLDLFIRLGGFVVSFLSVVRLQTFAYVTAHEVDTLTQQNTKDYPPSWKRTQKNYS